MNATAVRGALPRLFASRTALDASVRQLAPTRTRRNGGAVVASARAAEGARAAVSHTDVLVVGGGVGGTAAALALLRDHHRVVLTDPTGWIGGQLTAQGVAPADHAWIDSGLASTATYRELRDRVHRADGPHFTGEPSAWHAVLSATLRPYLDADRLKLITDAVPEHADVRNGVVRSVTLRTPLRRVRVHAKYVIDASELGDVLPLTGAGFVVGREAGRGPRGTGEPHNPAARPDPRAQLPFTVVAAVGGAGGNRMPSWCRLYDRFEPEYAARPSGTAHDPTTEVSLLNGPEHVCHERVLIPSCGPASAAMFEAGVRLAAEKTRGLARYRGLFLEPDVFGTADGLAPYPYIRESRRIRAEVTIREQDVAGDGEGPRAGMATSYPDSVGVGAGPIDVRRSDGLFLPTRPFQIPLRALLPRRMRNLLAGAKNIGTTQIANGCYRYHPVEWSIGEAAGHACAYALRHRLEPRDLAGDATAFGNFAAYLSDSGVQRTWPDGCARAEVTDFGKISGS